MPSPITLEYRTCSRKPAGFTALYGALLLLSFHWATVLYINSSYLEQFVSQRVVTGLFIVGAIFTIFILLYASPLLTRLGNVRLTILCTLFELCATLGMAYATTPFIAIPLFIIHQAVVPLLMFNIDIFMEELIGQKENSTGARRGILLSLASLMGALASLGMGKLLGPNEPNFSLAYTTSALILIPFLFIIVSQFKCFKDPHYPLLDIRNGIRKVFRESDIRNVFSAHFLLQLFFAWMVIYTPVYLSNVIGLNWEEIGVILFSGLMAYVFLEYAIGFIGDVYIGEKEMMAFGFAVIAIATSWFIFLDNSSVIAWMVTMFMTRVGASFVETTTESYFFKHTQGKDANVIGFFRITRPLSHVCGAILGFSTLAMLPFELLFVVLGLLMIPGLFFAMSLEDTK